MIDMDRKAIATVLIGLAASLCVQAQRNSHEWEAGINGAMVNVTRTTLSNFHQTSGGDYVFYLEEKNLYGGAELYLARRMVPWLYLDVQGTMGLARYIESEQEKQGYSFMAGPGIQFRPLVRSQWIQPYLRLGLNYFSKTFPTTYFGMFDNDVTKEATWRSEDVWNKGYTFDSNSFFPLSAGVGVIGWLGNRMGVKLQGQYLRSFGNKGASFAQLSGGLVFRIGGGNKVKSLADQYVESHPSDYDDFYLSRLPEKEREVVREVPVEKIVEKEVVKYVPSEKTLVELMDNVNFDFDKSTLTAESQVVLDVVADIIGHYPDTRFLVAGYTDAKGSEEYNERLSEERSKAVYDALLQRGVSGSRLAYKGFGKRMAVVPESASDEQRRGDRKVVIERVTDEEFWKYLSK